MFLDELLAGMTLTNRTLGFVNAPALLQRAITMVIFIIKLSLEPLGVDTEKLLFKITKSLLHDHHMGVHAFKSPLVIPRKDGIIEKSVAILLMKISIFMIQNFKELLEKTHHTSHEKREKGVPAQIANLVMKLHIKGNAFTKSFGIQSLEDKIPQVLQLGRRCLKGCRSSRLGLNENPNVTQMLDAHGTHHHKICQ